jgi:hypothetical protein
VCGREEGVTGERGGVCELMQNSEDENNEKDWSIGPRRCTYVFSFLWARLEILVVSSRHIAR